MNFYSLPVVINDRRELILELLPQGTRNDNNRNASFIVEVPSLTNFNLFSILRENKIKTFVEQTKDISLHNINATCTLQNGELTMLLREEAPQIAQPAVQSVAAPEAPKPEKISYEDIEDFKPKEQAVPKQEALPVLPEDSILLGNANDHVSLSFESRQNQIAVKGRQIREITQQLFDTNRITVHIVLDTNAGQYSNTIELYLAHPAQFLGIALDFGSESSQMAVKRYTNDFNLLEKKPEVENLFKNILSYHKNNNWLPQNETFDFYQEEKNTNFYKSIFFLKEKLSGHYEDIDKEVFIQDVANNLKMLVNTKDGFNTLTEQRFHQLPNLKIIHKHEDLLNGISFEIEKDGYDIPIKLSEIKQKVYNTILEVMIASFLKKEFIRYNNAQRFIRLMLLVPNNYDTNDINYIQTQLSNIFATLSQADYSGKILAWEVMTISESDASFIGYINKTNVTVQKNRDYIIIDAGKGTTDFSVIKTGSDNIFDLKPIYRNGFSGAGNMITYALFETVLHFIREQSSASQSDVRFIKEKIIKVLTSNDLERKNNFYAQLERLKFNFKGTNLSSQVKQNWILAKSGDIGFKDLIEFGDGINTLISLLNNIENIADFYGYVQDTCDFIANNTVAYLKLIKENKKDFDCAGVILTGRSFMFKPLADKIKERLHQELHIQEDKIVLLNSNELKEICIKGVFNNSIKLNSEMTGYPIQLIFEHAEEYVVPVVEKKPLINKKSLLARLFNDINTFDKVEKVLAFDNNIKFDKLQHSQFLIGSKTYRINGNDLFNKRAGVPYEAGVEFTHKGYFVRREQSGVVDAIASMKAIDDADNSDLSLVVPSLFPNYIDEKYLNSLERDDINRTPVTSGATSNIAPEQPGSNPLFF